MTILFAKMCASNLLNELIFCILDQKKGDWINGTFCGIRGHDFHWPGISSGCWWEWFATKKGSMSNFCTVLGQSVLSWKAQQRMPFLDLTMACLWMRICAGIDSVGARDVGKILKVTTCHPLGTRYAHMSLLGAAVVWWLGEVADELSKSPVLCSHARNGVG